METKERVDAGMREVERVTDLVVGDEQPAKLPAKRRAAAVAAPLAPVQRTPMDLIAMAVERGDSVETIEKLMALAERMDKIQAQKAFVAAMTKFKQNPPRIEKTRDADVKSKRPDAASYGYKFANLADVCNAIIAGLATVGISHRWVPQQKDGNLAITCVLTHEMGHSESVMLAAGLDQSGGKNNLQALGSSASYLERYTLLAATGLAVDDQQDDDGAGFTEEERTAVRDATQQSRGKNGEQKGPAASLLSQARMAADGGRDAFGKFWKDCTPTQRNDLRNDITDLEQRVAKREANGGGVK